MRKAFEEQPRLGEVAVHQVALDNRSRDAIPQVLRGLQALHSAPGALAEVYRLMEEEIGGKGVGPAGEAAPASGGRPGMHYWRMLVLGSLRINCAATYDRLMELANEHATIRKMLGHTPFIDDPPYSLQTIKDNVRLMTPALIENIHKVVVRACLRDMGLEGKPLDVAADSFPCETDVHYPTDVTLLADAARTAARIASRLPGADGWRQLEHLNRQLKRSARACAKAGQGACKARDAAAKAEGKAASAKSAARRGGATGAKAKMAADAKAGADVRASKARARQTAACGKFLAAAGVLLAKVAATLAALADPIRSSGSPQAQFAAQEADRLMALGRMLADQVRRRVINGESIRQEEKIFSVFEPHTEWIAKGKAGTPQQMGVNVCVASGPRGLILSTIVMFKVSDAKVAVEIAEKVKDVVGPALHSVSYDKGFWSPDNHEKLSKIVPLPVLPKKGGRGEAVRQREEAAPFKARRKAHAVVESSIAALQKHGLCRCLDHGKDGLSRAVALGALARNLQILGRFHLDREAKSEAKSKAIKAGLARRRLAAEAAGAATAA